jgi:hypothetical protein
MKTNFSKKKVFFVSGISILAFLIFDGTPFGNGITDKMFYKFYEFFIQNRLMCIQAIEKYNDAFLENSIQFEARDIPYFNNDVGAAEIREKAAEKVYKRFCFLN